MKTILHVTGSLGGGVTAEIAQQVQLQPQHRHVLLATLRDHDEVDVNWENLGVELILLPRGTGRATRAIRTAYKQIRPDFIHLHGFKAGKWGRLAWLPRHRVIYSPHCYQFERRDINFLQRALYYLLEEVLAIGGGTVAAISPREQKLARWIMMPQRVVFVPNSVSSTKLQPRPEKRRGTPLVVGMMGRLEAQKGPDFFAATAAILQKQNVPVQFVWFGDGIEHPRLEHQGIDVTGWLPQKDLWAKLAQIDLYFHTARWEGCPMAVLEAAALNIPILGRAVPSLCALPLKHTVATPEAAAAYIAQLVDGKGWVALKNNASIINDIYTADNEKAALRTLYGS